MYKTTLKTSVKTENSHIEIDGYSTIKITNLGDEIITINDNIPLPVNSIWKWKNDPGVTINTPIYIRFSGSGSAPKALIEQYYYQK